MALIKCPECDHDISESAVSCPYCGYPVKESSTNNVKKRSHKRGWIWLIFACVIVFLLSKCNKSLYSNTNNSTSKKAGSYYSFATSIPKTGKEGALAQAKSYLRSSAFSYKGLIEQLEFHGYSTTEATYGADNCGANWKEQAVLKAKSYIRSSGFSYKGLREQLEFEGFTEAEAKYGADNCNADWNEQAAIKAKSYMRTFPNWSKSELIDQLEFEKFTHEQAKYGAYHCK